MKVTHQFGGVGVTACGIKTKADRSIRIVSIGESPTCGRCKAIAAKKKENANAKDI